ncbi:metal-dependent hydrolase [Aquabacterium fontiphilum]|jgi:predicted metal-dependent hydrolase|uniref:metal-dependent hydrolase n=1 Tax=Aquabacterium fontiphilum TaxID=450365 RepID=UPI001378654D|nr:metal-dependent hydrolase [Aquabacterium fontiphilum]NBD21088.1 metal-dependent hydrolase [Aquabacterium fontiphilum]
MHDAHTIVPREKLDFGLDGDIPQYWFGGDPFKTRLFDAMSTIFPEGERFFISCVRDFRDRVTDPKLQQDIKDFMRQEGQHGIVHGQYNERLKRQGIDVDMLEGITRHMLFKVERKYFSAEQTLAETAAAEHMTAIMAHGFFARKEVLGSADARMRAMYAWHAMEEVEHKAVAFDVMQKVAKVGYFRRVTALLLVTLGFNIHSLLTANYMLKVDGFSRGQRYKLMAKGMWWLFKPGGLYSSMARHYLQYFKPGFHPWDEGQMQSYRLWLDTFNRTGDPILAGEVLHASAA